MFSCVFNADKPKNTLVSFDQPQIIGNDCNCRCFSYSWSAGDSADTHGSRTLEGWTEGRLNDDIKITPLEAIIHMYICRQIQ